MQKILLSTLVLALLTSGLVYSHTWTTQWTPEGWTWCFGGKWEHGYVGGEAWWAPVFVLETKARQKPTEFKKAKRAEWVGEVMGETKATRLELGGGDFWQALAYQIKRQSAADIPCPKRYEGSAPSEPKLDDKDRLTSIDQNGAISIPASACERDTREKSDIILMESSGEGKQIHITRQRTSNNLSTFTYTFDCPKAGNYALTSEVVTVHKGTGLSLKVNENEERMDLSMPYTVGEWQKSQPLSIELKKGKNQLQFQAKQGSRGISIKRFLLTPLQVQ